MKKTKKQTKKGYKVILIEDDKCKSISLYSPVIYSTFRKTRRPFGCGPLAVFDDLDSAIKFRNRNVFIQLRLTVWACEYQPSKDKTLWMAERGWKEYEMVENFPRGTKFADWVKITRKVI